MYKSGIYKVTNIINRKAYIGSTIDFDDRFRRHRYALRSNRHDNEHLQRSWNKHGEANFKFEIIEEIEDTKLLNNVETEYIKKFKTNEREFGYNLASPYGNHVASEEYKKNMSEVLIGREFTDEHKMNLSRNAKNREKMSEGIKNKISRSVKKLWQDPEYRKNQIEKRKKLWEDEEFRNKMSKAKKGQTPWNKGKRKNPFMEKE